MNELALCAGIGGISLGLKRAGFRTVCYVENAPYPVSVLKARMRDGQLDDAPIWDDVTTFDGTPWRGRVDIVTAGFPCQPFSTAGKRRGTSDKRHLWPSVFKTICTAQPRYVLLENVPGLLNMDKGRAAGSILADLASWFSDCGGGQIECLSIRASDVGAPHRRERVFLVSYAAGNAWQLQPRQGQDIRNQFTINGKTGNIANVADTNSKRLEIRSCFGGDTREKLTTFERSCSTGAGQWSFEPSVVRVVDGVPYRVERLTALGNAVVPQVAEWVGQQILYHDREGM